jgi:hypothetical protein
MTKRLAFCAFVGCTSSLSALNENPLTQPIEMHLTSMQVHSLSTILDSKEDEQTTAMLCGTQQNQCEKNSISYYWALVKLWFK